MLAENQDSKCGQSKMSGGDLERMQARLRDELGREVSLEELGKSQHRWKRLLDAAEFIQARETQLGLIEPACVTALHRKAEQ